MTSWRPLTRREKGLRAAACIARGHSIEVIALAFGVKPNTVKIWIRLAKERNPLDFRKDQDHGR